MRRKVPTNIKSHMEVIFHVLAWIIIFVLPHMLVFQTNDPEANDQLFILLGAPLSLAFVFYSNYLWLVPKYFLNQQRRKFLGFNIVVFAVAFIVMNQWVDIVRTKHDVNQPKRIELREEPHERILSPNDIPHHRSHPYDVRAQDRRDSRGWLVVAYKVRDILLFGLVAVLAIFIQQGHQLNKAEEARKEAELRQSEAEVRWLTNQVSPHFLLNTLNNIYALISIDKDEAQQAVQSLSKMLRHMLYENHNEYTQLGKEIEFITKYVDLMKLRISKGIEVLFNVDIVGSESQLVTPLLLIPLVENAFKHGISNSEYSFVHIGIKTKDGKLYCNIENSNHPKTQSDRSGSGIGIELMQKRLDSSYPNKYYWEHGPTENNKTYKSNLIITL